MVDTVKCVTKGEISFLALLFCLSAESLAVNFIPVRSFSTRLCDNLCPASVF